jgi:hypothetical protein
MIAPDRDAEGEDDGPIDLLSPRPILVEDNNDDGRLPYAAYVEFKSRVKYAVATRLAEPDELVILAAKVLFDDVTYQPTARA